jgi:hypothetical protein
LASLTLLWLAACAPTATPAPGAGGTSGAARPADTPAATAASAPGATEGWQTEWDRTLAAARSEGRVVVGGPVGQSLRDALMGFQKTYPEIQVEYYGMPGPEFVPKIRVRPEFA